MNKIPTIRLACWDYDRTRSLIDGLIKPDAFNLSISVMRPREAFTRMLEHEEFDVAEVSLANYMQLKAAGDERFVAIPVALSRMFRHSCIYIRAGSGIETPKDLAGRRVGAMQLDSTGVIFIKGLLSDVYGVTHDKINWVLGGLEVPYLPRTKIEGHGSIEFLGEGETLVSAFRKGKIDVIVSNHIPSLFLNGDPSLIRLFPDFKLVEQDYFRTTGLFPIMHVVALRASVHINNPILAKDLYNAFCKSRDEALKRIYDTDALRVSLPWLIDEFEESRRVLGADFWSYGGHANEVVWTTLGRYLVEQHLAPRTVPVQELFVAGL